MDLMSVDVEQALLTRRSVRGFLPRPVEHALVVRILELAARAPSGTNTQPWRVHVLTGRSRDELVEHVLRADGQEPGLHVGEYDYYPKTWREPYLGRRRKVGYDLYGLLGIAKGDKDGMAKQHARNYEFFGAPVGLIFVIDRDLEIGSWLDYGMFLQSIMIAARGAGLDTCPQQAFARYHRVIADYLQLPQSEMVVCGMAMGYADLDEPANQLVTDRMALDEFVRFRHD
nr:nitroreductase [Paraburkholderia piptadeniae]